MVSQVRVYASSVNFDLALVTGKSFPVRLMAGRLRNRNLDPGKDIGEVEAVGKDVKQFRPGDEVFGDIFAGGAGGFAEYASVPESALVCRPI
jgi:NADPH:quinone reductase-like Zn-dependent oxidoreductase